LSPAVLIALSLMSLSSFRYAAGDVGLDVEIKSCTYSYTLTNHGPDAIVAFEVPHHVSYYFTTPDGWEKRITPSTFKAWIERGRAAIGRGESGTFTYRVSTQGAVLGEGKAKIWLRSGKRIEIPGVLVPVPEPRSYILVTAGMILAVSLLHFAVVSRNRSRCRATAGASPSDA